MADGLRIHHRKHFNVVMMIPSKDRMVARRAGRDPVTRQELPAVVTQKYHRVELDHNGDGFITLDIWQDIERSGYANHFLLMPDPVTNPPTQKMSNRSTAKTHKRTVVDLGTETLAEETSTLHQFSTKIQQPIGSK